MKILTSLILTLSIHAQSATLAQCSFDEYGNPLVCSTQDTVGEVASNVEVQKDLSGRPLSKLEKWVLKKFGVTSLCAEGRCAPYINGNP